MKRILEVCDSTPIREIISQVCREMGFAVVEAACGDEAIVLFRERGPFDLVLTDLYYFDEITDLMRSQSHLSASRIASEMVFSLRNLSAR